MKSKIDWQGLYWIIFHGINWRRDIKDLAIHLYKTQFPKLYAAQDKMQHYINMVSIDKTTEDIKGQFIAAAIKTEYGREQLAKIMVAPMIRSKE